MSLNAIYFQIKKKKRERTIYNLCAHLEQLPSTSRKLMKLHRELLWPSPVPQCFVLWVMQATSLRTQVRSWEKKWDHIPTPPWSVFKAFSRMKSWSGPKIIKVFVSLPSKNILKAMQNANSMIIYFKRYLTCCLFK